MKKALLIVSVMAANFLAIGADVPAYFASKKSEVFHKADCRSVATIKLDNLIGFPTRELAILGGKRPCQICKP
jgi:methylphosphotriester-DNA--protein-cysteine methyltransferase